MSHRRKPKGIDEYIESVPGIAQTRLREMLECLRSVAPAADEAIKWGTPALSYNRVLFTFAAYKKHISFYPTPAAIEVFSKELETYETSTSTIKFPLDEPLPLTLIRKIAAFRVKEVIEKDAKWM